MNYHAVTNLKHGRCLKSIITYYELKCSFGPNFKNERFLLRINMVILIVVLQFNLLPKFNFSKISIKRDKCDINCKKTYRRHLEIDEKLSKNSDQLRAQPKSKLCLLPVAGLRITKYQSRYFYHYQILQDKKHFLHYIIYITFYLKTKCNSDII